MRADQPSLLVTAARPPWTQWTGTGGLPHRPRGLPPPAPATSSASECLADLSLAVATERVYDAVDDLARALLAQRDAYTPWQRRDPAFKPVVSGFLWTPSGPRRVTVMLDTGATHCFVCAQLADLLKLPQGSAPGPRAVSMASPDTTRSRNGPLATTRSLPAARHSGMSKPLEPLAPPRSHVWTGSGRAAERGGLDVVVAKRRRFPASRPVWNSFRMVRNFTWH